MRSEIERGSGGGACPAVRWAARGWAAAVVAVGLGAAPAAAAPSHCSDTAADLRTACGHELFDDWGVASAGCLNISDATARAACQAEVDAALDEGETLCDDQLAERLAACALLGEERYDPEFDPLLFDADPADPASPNPLFPLAVGNVWEYASGEETNVVEVLDQTKLIEAVRCLVVRDQVFRDGDLVEDTDDWYAFALDGAVWYCGEEVKDYESFAGDAPEVPELVSIDGSFKPGRDLDKPGIIFLADPAPGDVYLEEFSLGNAEDVTEILSTTYSYGDDATLDELVPQALADHLCDGDCVVTRNWSLLEPGIFARKYLAPGIGVFLEVEPGEGVVVRLTDCNFDPRCATLPAAPATARPGPRAASLPRAEGAGRPQAARERSRPAAARGADSFCSDTAQLLFTACGHETQDDYFVASAGCRNFGSAPERNECLNDRDDDFAEGEALCDAQLAARLALCAELGEDRYAPSFDPLDFDADPGDPADPSLYLPLGVGNRWEYSSPDELVRVEALDATKLVEGVACLVVRDRVYVGDQLVEDTDDWLAQALDGAVWYCGEEAKEYETFPGDQPLLPELVSIDGSFKAGRDLAQPGILALAAPVVGDRYREEFSLGNAEDVAEVLSTTYSYGESQALDELVPQALADLLCDHDCVVTRNSSPLEPDGFERKYHAPGIGVFLEVDPPEQEVVQLTDCNVDPRCAQLPDFPVFGDGFESGDAAAWSVTAP
jgi:hypothetical protein